MTISYHIRMDNDRRMLMIDYIIIIENYHTQTRTDLEFDLKVSDFADFYFHCRWTKWLTIQSFFFSFLWPEKKVCHHHQQSSLFVHCSITLSMNDSLCSRIISEKQKKNHQTRFFLFGFSFLSICLFWINYSIQLCYSTSNH